MQIALVVAAVVGTVAILGIVAVRRRHHDRTMSDRWLMAQGQQDAQRGWEGPRWRFPAEARAQAQRERWARMAEARAKARQARRA